MCTRLTNWSTTPHCGRPFPPGEKDTCIALKQCYGTSEYRARFLSAVESKVRHEGMTSRAHTIRNEDRKGKDEKSKDKKTGKKTDGGAIPKTIKKQTATRSAANSNQSTPKTSRKATPMTLQLLKKHPTTVPTTPRRILARSNPSLRMTLGAC